MKKRVRRTMTKIDEKYKVFELKIVLGNDAMSRFHELGKALMAISEKLSLEWNVDGIVRDGNGNKVGEFKFVE